MSLSKEAINSTLAEFMGTHGVVTMRVHTPLGLLKKVYIDYTESLDALVPVLEKLDIEYGRFYPQSCPLIRFGLSKHINQDTTAYYIGDAKTIQHAAALAAYKAIEEINKEAK